MYMVKDKEARMTNKEMFQTLIQEMIAEGKDPMYIVGYLEAFMGDYIDRYPKRLRELFQSDLEFRLNDRPSKQFDNRVN